MRKAKLYLILFTLLVLVKPVLAQDSSAVGGNKPTKFLVLGMTANAYRGDLMPHFSKYGAAFHLGIRYNRAKRVNGEFEFMSGFVSGQNSDYSYDNDASATPNNFFFTNYLNLNYHLNINLYDKHHFRCFLSQGIGLFRFTSYDQDYLKLNDQLATRELGEDYSNMTFNFPTHLGLMYTLEKGYGIMMRMGWANISSDYVDNISNWGNTSKKDNILTFKISFIAPLSY